MQLKTKDKLVQAVLRKMDDRSIIGQKKYGQTMQKEIETGKKDLHMFLTDVQEEIMDALLYLEAAKRCLQDEVEEEVLKQYETKFENIDVDEEEEL